jgi:hypothetical protein
MPAAAPRSPPAHIPAPKAVRAPDNNGDLVLAQALRHHRLTRTGSGRNNSPDRSHLRGEMRGEV